MMDQRWLKYPNGINCQENSDIIYGSKSKFRSLAESDKEMTMKAKGIGYYQCYCTEHSSAGDLLKDYSEGPDIEFCYQF